MDYTYSPGTDPNGSPDDEDSGHQDPDTLIDNDTGTEDTHEPASDEWNDIFDLSAGVPIDVMMYGDTSSSMAPYLTTLADNLTEFTSSLETSGLDWQLIAVTGPDGCGVDGIMTPETPDLHGTFTTAILTEPPGHIDDEAGLQNTAEAVAQSTSGGCNEGFLRDTALLHVIYISDENDESPGFGTDGYWTSYYDAMVAGKGDSERLIFSAVGGPPGECSDAETAHGYWEIVEASSGEFLSICDDWSSELDVLADASVKVSVFDLSKTPDVESLTVWVNADPITANWTYDASQNQVVFSAESPTSGDLVEIRYLAE